MSSKISVYLETDTPGRIPANSLCSALAEFTNLLGEVEVGLSQSGRRSLNWDITDIRFGSVLIELEASPTDEDSELAGNVIDAAFSGLEMMSDRPDRPEYFTDEALEHARRLPRLLSDSVSRIIVSVDEGVRHVEVTEHLADNIRQILEHMESYGSVEGILEVLSNRGSLHFSVREVSTRKRVRCNFDEELIEKAIAAWRKRVVVFGRIRVDNQGNPHTVWVWDISILRTSQELPTPEEVKGLSPDMTGGLSSEEYAKERYGQ